MWNRLIRLIPVVTVLGGVYAHAATIRVPADQPTIQAGIVASSDGDTVLVAAGNYSENLDYLGRRIHVVGEGGADVTILTPANPNVRTVNLGSSGNSQTQFRGFTVTGGQAGEMLYLGGGTPIVRDNVFRDFPSTASNAVAIHVAGGNPLISRNVFHDILGISCVGIMGGAAQVINNTFDGNARGFFCVSGGPSVAKNNIVVNSTEYGIAGSWLEVNYNDVFANGADYAVGAEPGPDDISADPLFLDPSIHNYRLQYNSPCIDMGDPAPEYMDADGSRNDMGASASAHVLPIASNLRFFGEDRTHVANNTPTIAWTYFDTTASQESYDVEVGTDNDWLVAEMWADGPVTSGDSMAVYSGVPLADGGTYWMRARVSNGANWGDWTGLSFHMNTVPTPPITLSPDDGADVSELGVILEVSNATDSEDDARLYDFVVYADAALTIVAQERNFVIEQLDVTTSGPVDGLTSGLVYWWRVRAYDGFEYSDWSSVRTFHVSAADTVHVPQDQPTIQAGINACPDFGVVLVAPGVYSESFAYGTKKVRVVSASGPLVTQLRAPTPSAIIVNLGNSGDAATQLRGFTVVGGSNAPAAISVAGGAPVVRENIFRDFLGEPFGAPVVIYLGGGDALITRNVFYDNAGLSCVGIFSGGGRIIGNTFEGNDRGFFTISGQGVALNNIVANSGQYGIFGDFATLDYNDVWNNSPNYDGGAAAGVNDISLDPLLAESATHNYQLLPGSPCLDAGHPDPIYNDPDGSRADIGALGFIGGLPVGLNIRIANEDPLHVIGTTPQICWHFLDTIGSPSGYEIEVGTDTNWAVAELWSTGPITSSDTCATYAGSPLPDGQVWWLRVRLNNGSQWGEWKESIFRQNTSPTAPMPYAPTVGDTVRWNMVVLTVDNGADTEQDSLQYEFEVSLDQAFFGTIVTFDSIPGGQLRTSTPVLPTLAQLETFYWRCRAGDGFEMSPWSSIAEFQTRGAGVVYVPDGEPTIQDAVNVSGDLDTIIILPGTYSGSVVISSKALLIRARDGLGSVFVEADEDAFLLTHTTDTDPVVFEGLAIRSVDGRGIASNFLDFEMRNCRFEHAARAMVHYSGARGVFRSCEFYEDGPHAYGPGFLIDNYGELVMDRCIFYSLSYEPTFQSTAGNVTMTNTTVYDCAGGFDFAGYEPVPGLVINNIFAFVAGTAVITNASGPYIDYNLYYGNGLNIVGGNPGDASVSGDPLLVGPATHDFTPLAGSPCIDAGHPSALYYDPDGSRNDIGAIPAGVTCPCPCHADPYCDGQTEIIDVVITIGVAFRNITPINDEACAPYQNGVAGRTDVNCSGTTDVVDIVKMIDVAFRNRPATEAFCDPCTIP